MNKDDLKELDRLTNAAVEIINLIYKQRELMQEAKRPPYVDNRDTTIWKSP